MEFLPKIGENFLKNIIMIEIIELKVFIIVIKNTTIKSVSFFPARRAADPVVVL